MSAECYICGAEGQHMGTVKKMVFKDLEQHITKEEHYKVNGQDSGWTEGYYNAVFEPAGDVEVYQCDNCIENMLKKAKRNAIIAGVVAVLLLGTGIANFALHFIDTVFSFFLLFFGAISALLMVMQIMKAKRKNIQSSAIEEFVLDKNDGEDYASFCDFGVGREKEKFKPESELYVSEEEFNAFEARDTTHYILKIPFSTGDYFDYDLWKEINSIP